LRDGATADYFRARHYDPAHSRLTSEDPLNGMVHVIGGDLYGYAANSPVFLMGAETTSSWMMGAQMKPCPQP